MKGKILLMIAMFFWMSPPAMADDPAEMVVGKRYIVQGTMNLRSSPPKGLLYSLGEKQGEIKKDEAVIVEDVKAVKTLLGSHFWVEIKKDNPATGKVDKGWVYAGEKGKESLLKEKAQTPGGPDHE